MTLNVKIIELRINKLNHNNNWKISNKKTYFKKTWGKICPFVPNEKKRKSMCIIDKNHYLMEKISLYIKEKWIYLVIMYDDNIHYVLFILVEFIPLFM